MSQLELILTVVGFWLGYIAAGYITAWAWQSLTFYPIPDDDLQAIRILWWVFASLGLGLGVIHLLDNAMYRTAPPDEAQRIQAQRAVWERDKDLFK